MGDFGVSERRSYVCGEGQGPGEVRMGGREGEKEGKRVSGRGREGEGERERVRERKRKRDGEGEEEGLDCLCWIYKKYLCSVLIIMQYYWIFVLISLSTDLPPSSISLSLPACLPASINQSISPPHPSSLCPTFPPFPTPSLSLPLLSLPRSLPIQVDEGLQFTAGVSDAGS